MTDHGLFDIHCHLIPGVDDGAQDLEETRRLLRMEYEQGVRNIIATPHYRDQMFDTPIHTIRSQFALVEKCVQEFNQELAKEDRMRIYLGCEFHANMQMSRMLDEGRVSTMADSGYVLVEFSGNAEYSYIEDRLRSLIIVGYRPIIAHVESSNIDKYEPEYTKCTLLWDGGKCILVTKVVKNFIIHTYHI